MLSGNFLIFIILFKTFLDVLAHNYEHSEPKNG